MNTLQKALKKINIACPFAFNEPMHLHTSFKIGGPADVFARPKHENHIKEIFSFCLKNNIPYFSMGCGANILVSDKGIRGVVISLEDFSGISINKLKVTALSGTPLQTVVEETCKHGLGGLDAFHKMPGSVGGAVWMNARCYNVSISDLLECVEIIDDSLEIKRMAVAKHEFSYKRSPFQNQRLIIVKGTFKLENADPEDLKKRMEEIYNDRRNKGHFLYPCAGSVFKNNRDFGMPSGRLIDTLNLKGYRIGGARVSPQHANIIINTGTAKARDVKALIEYIQQQVFKHYGFQLEKEILYVGEGL
ncbi:MAG: UDP-N-acetylmuramate dehydrogenase [Spirochaetales bacterium]|nr:UDP-N-acetylmuramate dehydrogenase [Spirochaetales bacterium]